jgi:hypothetical protein
MPYIFECEGKTIVNGIWKQRVVEYKKERFAIRLGKLEITTKNISVGVQSVTQAKCFPISFGHGILPQSSLPNFYAGSVPITVSERSKE